MFVSKKDMMRLNWSDYRYAFSAARPAQVLSIEEDAAPSLVLFGWAGVDVSVLCLSVGYFTLSDPIDSSYPLLWDKCNIGVLLASYWDHHYWFTSNVIDWQVFQKGLGNWCCRIITC